MRRWIRGIAVASVALIGCAADSDDPMASAEAGSSSRSDTGSPSGSSGSPEPTMPGSATAEGSSSGTGLGAESGSSSSGGEVEPTDPFDVLCGTAPPDGAQMPAPLPEPTEPCPAFVPGDNALMSAGNERSVMVVAPSDLQPDEQLPVVFLWHWLGGSAESFIEVADVQNAADQFRFLALVPVDKGDLIFRWPFTAAEDDERVQEEFTYFDDVLACAAQSYPIDNTCVSSVGVSAGALFTAQLGWARSEYLSSIVSLSGGTGGVVRPWGGASHILPAMVLWGGPDDFCVAVDFEMTSADLEANLEADGHAVVECEHNCGHAAPPFETDDPELTPYAAMWRFFLDHPYWVEPGQTRWADEKPSFAPQWCSVGVGASTPREGECPDGPGC